MQIISKRALRECWEFHPESEQSILSWYREVERADWPTPAQVMERYPNATIVGLDRVVFRIQRNDYRIVARIFYPGCMVYIRFVGTHKDYNHIKAEEV